MRKLLAILSFAFVSISGNAQTILKGDLNDDGNLTVTDVMLLINMITGNIAQSYNFCPDKNHPHVIDLGLPSGKKWACCNVGAYSPEEYGGYYAWGEIEEKDEYTLENYIHNESAIDIGEDICGTEYDVATKMWGDIWKMPNNDEIYELINNCTYKWITINGIKGGQFTGSNGGSIFLPATGFNRTPSWDGNYWSGNLDIEYDNGKEYILGANLEVEELGAYWGGISRFKGLSVRPVIAVDSSNPTIYELVLSDSLVILEAGTEKEVEIIDGNGDYMVQSPNPDIVTANLHETTITINGLRKGESYINVVDTKSGQTVVIEVWVTNNVAYQTCPDDNHPHMIDLGLSSGTKWACCNVDATAPEMAGGHYAWGETKEKEYYGRSNYEFYDNGVWINIGEDICGTQYDVAHVKWHGSWQMPNTSQSVELFNECTYEWTNVNGIYGGKFTGPNGGVLFLPASEYYDNTGNYWTGIPFYDIYPGYAITLTVDRLGGPDSCGGEYDRYVGCTIRPVSK